MPIFTFKKPYKTCRKWRLLEPKIEKGLGNHQKSITQRRFSRRVFQTSKNLIKPTKNKVFQNAKTRVENPYKTCRIWRLLEPKIANVTKFHPKSITQRRFSQRVFKTSENLIKLMENIVLRNAKTRCEDPYKTKWNSKTFGTICGKSHQKV